jgi:hypothetical protein
VEKESVYRLMVTSMRESGWMIRDMATELISGMMETGTLESGNLIKEKDKANSGSKIETIMRGSGIMIKDMVWEQKSGPMEINMWANG